MQHPCTRHHPQAQDYRIQYDSIVRVFLLPKTNVPQVRSGAACSGQAAFAQRQGSVVVQLPGPLGSMHSMLLPARLLQLSASLLQALPLMTPD